MLTARRPDAAEIFSTDDFRVLRESLDEPFVSQEDLEYYVNSWREPGATARRSALVSRRGPRTTFNRRDAR
jgi:hypothetical protein